MGQMGNEAHIPWFDSRILILHEKYSCSLGGWLPNKAGVFIGAIKNVYRLHGLPLLGGSNIHRVGPLKEKAENPLRCNQKLATSEDFS